MAYFVLSANGEELDRQELRKAVVIGRSAECDVAVRDILLSRQHCRLEPARGGWRVVDLSSKNGTRLGWQKIQEHLLCNGDMLRVGRTCLTFYSGAFVPAPPQVAKKSRMVRPADPFEALNGTVTDFVYVEEEAPASAAAGAGVPEAGEFVPSPPGAPGAVMSSAAPAVAVAEAPRCVTRPLPRPIVRREGQYHTGARRAVVVDLSLQATPQQATEAPVVAEAAPAPAPEPASRVQRLWGVPARLARSGVTGVRALLQTTSYCLLQLSAMTW
jgi:pSer/pThr/pTyr-binding forkhead associated (FHA) protein